MRHIIFDARALQEQVDGIGRYSLGVMKAMLRLKPEWNFSVIACPGGTPHLKSLPLEVIESRVPRFRPGEDRKLSPLIESSGADCYLNFSMAGPRPSLPTVVTVHDVMVLTVPGYFGGSMLKNLLARMVFRRRIGRSVVHASVIAVPSDFSRMELSELFPGMNGKVCVTGEGQDLFQDLQQPVKPVDREDFILYVGNARAYKNVTRLIVAYSRLKAIESSFPDLRMVVRKDRAYNRFMTELEDSHASEHIHVTSHVSDAQIRELYMKCLFLVMPSIKEGFGLPALEAMAAGTPVLASRGTALEELVGKAGILVDPSSIGEIMTGMAEMWTDEKLRADLSSRSRKRASGYTWERTAGIIADGMEEII